MWTTRLIYALVLVLASAGVAAANTTFVMDAHEETGDGLGDQTGADEDNGEGDNGESVTDDGEAGDDGATEDGDDDSLESDDQDDDASATADNDAGNDAGETAGAEGSETSQAVREVHDRYKADGDFGADQSAKARGEVEGHPSDFGKDVARAASGKDHAATADRAPHANAAKGKAKAGEDDGTDDVDDADEDAADEENGASDES